MWFSKTIAEKFKKNKIKGVILNFSSIYGLVAQDNSIYKNTKMNENIAYSAIKGAIISYTKLLSVYYSKYSIRANSISPGGVLTKCMDEDFVKNYSERVPIGRLASANEIAKASLFLVSDFSNYITGENLVVDGGWTAI